MLVEFPPAGGLFQFAVQLGEGLARRGRSVRVVTGSDPELSSREPGCRVEPILPTWHPTAGADVPEWWRKARRVVRAGRHHAAWLRLLLEIRRSRPDVVLWSAWRFPVDGWGVVAARRVAPHAVLGMIAHEPRPLVEQPGQDGHYNDSGATYQALRQAYATVDVVYTLGDSARQVVLDTWPVQGPVVVIPHGDEDAFRTGTPTGADETGPHLLFFGTVTGYKGLDDVLAVWPRVRAAVPDATLTVAGSLSADVDAAALRRRVAALDGVELRDGYVAVEDVPALMEQARAVVLPYRRASQSGVAHLAQTFARPAVATAVGDIPTVVRDGETGLVVPPGDGEALAAGAIRLLTDPALARRLGDAGRAGLTAGASWDDVAAAVLAGLPVREPR
ncbi:hypothetical protein ADJ73_00055 [Arsenicicoccus sp. oral taxon 190]|nr:hypothetical protein ADJ73_00055 [Arsenicicoccus sp. oral taxon 190]